MRVVVIGAGGHAKVVIDALESSGDEIVAVVDERRAGTAELLGYAVVAQAPSDADGFVVAIGDNAIRKARFEHYLALGMTPVPAIHPSAIIAEDVTIGPGAVVFAGVVVNRGAVIGANAILNTGCTVDHDCVIGDHVHVGPGVNLCGGVNVAEGTLLGVNASAIPAVSIGAWVTVGAGAAVVGDIPDDATCVGVPARPL